MHMDAEPKERKKRDRKTEILRKLREKERIKRGNNSIIL